MDEEYTDADARRQLRRRFLALRDRMLAEERDLAGREITRHLLRFEAFARTGMVLLYCHYRSEVPTRLLIDSCLQRKMTVCVPVTLPQPGQMVAARLGDPEHDLIPGYKGIPELRPELLASRQVDPALLEAVVVPGAVFDGAGYRLGYGGGYYDRFLAHAAPQALRIGLAFSVQMVRRLPVLSHDIPMDFVVTEQGIASASPRNLPGFNAPPLGC
ncbi:MAG: 5-formyltetrahydrofolate cyclo-ligase [Desulfobulbus sp.]|jgi:5-formyltetrahydrofolate cyclo-ligase